MEDRGETARQWLQGLQGHLWKDTPPQSAVNPKWYADSPPSASLQDGGHNAVIPALKCPFRYGNRRYPALRIHSSHDSNAQNINECVKIGEKRWQCYAIMRTEHVKTCELFPRTCLSADTWLHLNIGLRESMCSACMGAHGERFNA